MAWQLLKNKEEHDKFIQHIKNEGFTPTSYWAERFPCLVDYIPIYEGTERQVTGIPWTHARFIFVYPQDAKELLNEIEAPVTQTKRKIPHGLAPGQVG